MSSSKGLPFLNQKTKLLKEIILHPYPSSCLEHRCNVWQCSSYLENMR